MTLSSRHPADRAHAAVRLIFIPHASARAVLGAQHAHGAPGRTGVLHAIVLGVCGCSHVRHVVVCFPVFFLWKEGTVSSRSVTPVGAVCALPPSYCDIHTALAACDGFDLCHKYILYLYLYFHACRLCCVSGRDP